MVFLIAYGVASVMIGAAMVVYFPFNIERDLARVIKNPLLLRMFVLTILSAVGGPVLLVRYLLPYWKIRKYFVVKDDDEHWNNFNVVKDKSFAGIWSGSMFGEERFFWFVFDEGRHTFKVDPTLDVNDAQKVIGNIVRHEQIIKYMRHSDIEQRVSEVLDSYVEMRLGLR